jgi:hypothetical protein
MAATERDPAERRGCLRWFYRDWGPTRPGRLVNGAWAWLSGLGLTPRILLTLPGRHPCGPGPRGPGPLDRPAHVDEQALPQHRQQIEARGPGWH